MAWHLAFVGYFIASFGNPLNHTILALDLVGLIFLLLLTITSFRSTARHLTAANWRRLHKTGVYAIWLLATFIYLENARSSRDLFHVCVSGLLIAAWLLRVAAWGRSLGRRDGAGEEWRRSAP
jgi:methionine sulfoxide reductase heme-binding subunit